MMVASDFAAGPSVLIVATFVPCSSKVFEARRQIAVAGRGPQHELRSFRHDADLRHRDVAELCCRAARSRPRDDGRTVNSSS